MNSLHYPLSSLPNASNLTETVVCREEEEELSKKKMSSFIHLRSWNCLLCFTLFLVSTLLLLQTATCKDSDEDDLLQGISSYRQSRQLPQFTKNKKAGCLADEIADQMDNKPCVMLGPTSMGQSPTSSYMSVVNKCKIEPSSATDAIVLPICVQKLESTHLLTNYTRSSYARYLNDSKYTGVGMGSKDDWMIMVLTTNAQTGSFSIAHRLVGSRSFGLIVVFLGGLFFN